MQSIDVLGIEQAPTRKELIEVVTKAYDYFPEGIWRGIRYIGELKIPKSYQIRWNEKVYRAFDFEILVERMKRLRDGHKIDGPLLGLTIDPVMSVLCRFENGKLLRDFYCIHDAVIGNIGIVSLFRVDEEYSKKLVAHNLGHNRRLSHHTDPIDFMYTGLITEKRKLQNEPFCRKCEKILKEG